ncbi:hypothetical protein [Dactylosporangium matsuzakiense]|uniref:Uncharacterized protein n=1 Tax=Dactylosporangium matsuzakiense TaxID=53360 RepID=A0A9W6NLK0_9ACTN|nr:hypothetical protein [Dactylosporangium matsuzakiense]UWZ46612.1 hypothetical protein Dmats_09400 [Dactylosporangium matsuzakiense]GLL01256.1 hypothetical protein GCM10017581_029970 [Dactylosporangium matsuzakiense]
MLLVSAKAMGNVWRFQRWSAAAGVVAAFGIGLLAVSAAPAWAADPLELKADNAVQGKAGDKVQLRFTVKNNAKQPATVVIGVQTPPNAVMEPGDNPGCNIGGGGRTASCRANGTLAPDKSAGGAIVMTIKTGGQAAGRIGVQGGNTENFTLRATGAPSASPTATKSVKPTKTSSANASDQPTLAGDETFAPPADGGGVAVPQASDPATERTSGSGGGMGVGLWVGIIAIVGALGLIGSLFYFRRKDRNEPDTGMHPVVPAPAGGFPAYNPPPSAPTTYGSPQPATYGNPSAATQMINPNFGGGPAGHHDLGGQPSGPTQVIQPGATPNGAPGGADQTVIFRRPDEY